LFGNSKSAREVIQKIIDSDDILVISDDIHRGPGFHSGALEIRGETNAAGEVNDITLGFMTFNIEGAQKDLENGLGVGKPLVSPNTTTMAHELYHFYDAMDGSIEKAVYGIDAENPSYTEVDEDTGREYKMPNYTNFAEITAVDFENKVRVELDLPLRTHYGRTNVFDKQKSKTPINSEGNHYNLVNKNKGYSKYRAENTQLKLLIFLSATYSETLSYPSDDLNLPKAKMYGKEKGTTILEKSNSGKTEFK
jgi:hypothetical protein